MATITTKSVLSGISGRPISYDVGESSATRGLLVNSRVTRAISPTPDQKKPIPSQTKRTVGGRIF